VLMDRRAKECIESIMKGLVMNEKSSSEAFSQSSIIYTLMILQQKESLSLFFFLSSFCLGEKGVKIDPFFLRTQNHYSLLVLGPSLGPSSVEHNPDWSPLVTHVHCFFFVCLGFRV